MANAAKSQNCSTTTDQDMDAFPLSLAQEGLWVLDRISPGSAAYNMPETWRFKGELDRQALRASLTEIMSRHEILRTIFSEREGKPIQIVRPARPFELTVVDLTGDVDPQAECSRRVQTDARRPFDLASGPLLRIHLFRVKSDEHVMLVNMHHIISDAWSFGVFMREFAGLYNAFHCGKGSSLLELPIQFADYAVWQRGLMQGKALEECLTYWQRQLADHSGVLNLPTDRPRPTVRSDRGSAEFFSFSKELADKLKTLGRAHGTTLYVMLLAAFNAVLHRYTGEPDIVVGSPFSRRDRVETEGLIGYFVHTHALRTDLSGDPSFSELLKRVREVTVGAHSHQEIAFETIVNALQPERNPGYHPIFQVVFGLQTAFTEDCELPGLEFSRKELETGTSKFDWALLMTETSRDLSLRFEYSTDLFDRSTIHQFARHFERFLEEVARNPERKLSGFALLSPDEEQMILVEWNSTRSAYERDASIPELFESQVRQRPNAVALAMGGRRMSYDELNRRANLVARSLKNLGVRPEVAVGVCFERSFEMIIGILGILKVGGIYVPLDLSHPRERLRFIIDDTGVAMILTDNEAAFRDLELPALRLLGIDSATLDPISGRENIGGGASALNTAYILYTSGSTGSPKGTLVSHRAVVRLVRNTNYIEISADDVFLQFAPITFDASTFEIWGSLLNGGKLVLCSPGLPSFEELGRMIEVEKITILWLSAGLFHEMVEQKLPSLQGLRFLLAGGDTLSVSHVLKANCELSRCELINGYGPTENTTFSCCYRISKDWKGGCSVPIGRPISNSQAYILDPYLHPVPIGVVGELFVGGDGLARGYLNRPELTAEKFIANPFKEMGGSLMLYRTGDMVRWLADGNIEFLGRADDQVKIRGFRVEPAEVEAILKQHDEVESASVILTRGKDHQKSLTACVVPRKGCPISKEALRLHAERRLPAYMVPAHFLIIDRFPLTPNGKVDRRALLQLSAAEDQPESVRIFTSPRTGSEKQLANIWEELLGRRGISINDNFFHLGGNSLLAMQVISRVATVFRIELPVRVLFETPTIAGVAEAIAEFRSQPVRATLIQPIPRNRAADLLARLDALSEPELELLLEETESKTVSS